MRPVVKPVIGTPSYDIDTDEFTFAATVPDGATLHARWDSTDPSTCVTSPTGGTDSSYVPVVGGYGTLSLGTTPQCVSFFANDQDRHRYSDRRRRSTFTLPEPDEAPPPEIGTATWSAADHTFRAPVSYPAGTRLEYALSDDPASARATTPSVRR